MESNDKKESKNNKFNLFTKINIFEFKKNNKTNKNKELKDNQKKNIFLNKSLIYIIVTISILVILATFSTVVYIKNLKYKSYIKYEDKMKIYGFDSMYDNKSAKTDELVTKTEALKILLSAVFNTSDISNFALNSNEYPDAIWVDYAKSSGITNEDINKDNYWNNAKYIDVIVYFENSKVKILKEKIADTESKIEDINKYTLAEQTAIKDMIASQIIFLYSNNVNGSEKIFKGQLNELVINFVEKYNTITMNREKINVNPEKFPSNAKDFPYTLANIDKSVYEKTFNTQYSSEAMLPVELFRYKKEEYSQIQRFAEEYFNAVLNVNYNTITEDGFKTKLSEYLIYKPNDYAVKRYIENVKTNEIIIEGAAKVQFPVIYSDGISYRVRIRITFDIKNSKTKDNLIYLDYINGLKKTYEANKYDLIIDYYMTNAIDNSNIYMKEVDLYGSILDNKISKITQEVDKENYFKEGEDANS